MRFDNWGISKKSAENIAEDAMQNLDGGGKGVVDRLYDIISQPFKEQVVRAYNNYPSKRVRKSAKD